MEEEYELKPRKRLRPSEAPIGHEHLLAAAALPSTASALAIPLAVSLSSSSSSSSSLASAVPRVSASLANPRLIPSVQLQPPRRVPSFPLDLDEVPPLEPPSQNPTDGQSSSLAAMSSSSSSSQLNRSASSTSSVSSSSCALPLLSRLASVSIPPLARELRPILKQHQLDGVRFLWSHIAGHTDPNTGELLPTNKSTGVIAGRGSGCVLADVMGLGKTLQVIAVIDMYLNADPVRATAPPKVMVVAPSSVLENWRREIRQWLPTRHNIQPRLLPRTVKPADRLDVISSWYREGGVLLIGYEMLRTLATAKGDQGAQYAKFLLNPGAELVVLDEGHRIRSHRSQLNQMLQRVNTPRRICLSGYPLQNNLTEYWCMIDFVRPGFLSTRIEFMAKFETPIAKGQCKDSSESAVELSKKRSFVLQERLRPIVLRRGTDVLEASLPPRKEYVVWCALSPLQQQLYQQFLQHRRAVADQEARATSRKGSNTLDLLTAYNDLRLMLNHPTILRVGIDKHMANAAAVDDSSDGDGGDEGDVVDVSSDSDDDEEDSVASDEDQKNDDAHNSADQIDSLTAEPLIATNERDESVNNSASVRPFKRLRRATVASGQSEDDADTEVDDDPGSDHEAMRALRELQGQPFHHGTGPPSFASASSAPATVTEEHSLLPARFAWARNLAASAPSRDTVAESGKMAVLMQLLRSFRAQGDCAVVFSRSILTLDYIEKLLGGDSYASNEDSISRGNESSWKVLRFDGRTPLDQRVDAVHQFNRGEAHVFLISTKAGGEGISLVGGNRVVLMDVSWNPSDDGQAARRCYRYGQTKPVYIYRLVAADTMEMVVFNRQVVRETLSRRIVDDKPLQRIFTSEDLVQLFSHDGIEELQSSAKHTQAPNLAPAISQQSHESKELSEYAEAPSLSAASVLAFEGHALPEDVSLATALGGNWVQRLESYDLLLSADNAELLAIDDQQSALQEFLQSSPVNGKRERVGRSSIRAPRAPRAPRMPRAPRVRATRPGQRGGMFPGGFWSGSNVCLVRQRISSTQFSILCSKLHEQGGSVSFSPQPDTTHVVTALSRVSFAEWLLQEFRQQSATPLSALSSVGVLELFPATTTFHTVDWMVTSNKHRRRLPDDQMLAFTRSELAAELDRRIAAMTAASLAQDPLRTMAAALSSISPSSSSSSLSSSSSSSSSSSTPTASLSALSTSTAKGKEKRLEVLGATNSPFVEAFREVKAGKQIATAVHTASDADQPSEQKRTLPAFLSNKKSSRALPFLSGAAGRGSKPFPFWLRRKR